MSTEDPWEWLNFRYANDDLARCELILDGIGDGAARLSSTKVGDLRLALITIDYLADVLLVRQVSRLISLSGHGFAWESREQFDSKTRGLLHQGFQRRLALASRPYEGSFTLGLGDPIVSPERKR